MEVGSSHPSLLETLTICEAAALALALPTLLSHTMIQAKHHDFPSSVDSS